MLSQIGDMIRKASLVVVSVAFCLWIVTELMGGLTSKTGPKKPMAEQRLNLLTFAALGTPGAIWALVRTVQGKQRKVWEE